MKVVHSICNLLGPLDQQGWCDLSAITQNLIKLTIWAEFHNYTVDWGLIAYPSEITAIIIIVYKNEALEPTGSWLLEYILVSLA